MLESYAQFLSSEGSKGLNGGGLKLEVLPIFMFVTQGADEGADAAEYVKRMRQQNKLIMGIGHRIKSLSNPDMRVTIIKDYALKHFKNNKVLDFAMAVEQVGLLDVNRFLILLRL